MKPYKKPTIIGYNAVRGIIPLAGVAIGAPAILAGIVGAAGGAAAAALGASGAAAGISFGAAAGGAAVAALAGAAAGAAVARKGSKIIITEPAFALTARKNFEFD